MKIRILISNDDGIYSPGITALAKVASRFGEVRIVAPDVEQSSMGHAITASRPLRYKRIRLDDFEAYRVNGTPADCVALGAYNWEKVDVVLSGINLGSNLGNAMWHSGTLAAAKQAVYLSDQEDLETMLRYEVEAQIRCFESRDGKEGVRAFLEKRAPRFTGH